MFFVPCPVSLIEGGVLNLSRFRPLPTRVGVHTSVLAPPNRQHLRNAIEALLRLHPSCLMTGWPQGVAAPGGVGGGISPPPQPQTGRASFQASGFPDVSQLGKASARSHSLLWTTSTFIGNPPDWRTLPQSKTKHPAALCHVAGFPNLGLLRRLRHPSASSVKPEPTIVGLVARSPYSDGLPWFPCWHSSIHV